MKKTVYILHGWAYDVVKWHPFIEDLQAAGLDVKMLHVPGLTTEPLTSAWKIGDYLDWLKKEVGDQPAIFIGHSNGGRILLNFAIKYPKLVEQLILIDSAGIPRHELKARVKRNVLKVAAKTGKVFTKNEKIRHLLYKAAREQDYYKAQPVMRETMANLLQSDYELLPEKVTVPTHMIWGRDDTATPLKDAYALKKLIKNSDVHVIDGARHSPQFTHAAEVSKIIKGVVDGTI